MRWPFFILCVLGALGGPGAAWGQNSINPANIVTLVYKAGFQSGCGPHKTEFVLSSGNGEEETVPYRVQEGTLVITDVDWGYISGPPNQFIFLRLSAQKLSDLSKSSRLLESSVRLDGLGNGGASEHLSTGFAVQAGARICAEVPGEAEWTVVRLARVILRGYWVR